MNKTFITLTISVIVWGISLLGGSKVLAVSSSVVINEIMMDTSQSASAEFVELTNTSNEIVDLTGWSLEYLAAGGHDWRLKAEPLGLLAPGSRYLIVSEEVGVLGNQSASLGLARSGGHLRLLDNNVVVIDQVGWGAAIDPETAPALAGLAGNSLKRVTNEDGRFLDSDNNSLDFIVSPNPTPVRDSQPIEASCEEIPVVEVPTEEVPSTPIQEESPVEEVPVSPPVQTVYSTVTITELLIDPASPSTDKDDEFIELYNPHDFFIDLTGYVLQSGSSFQYSYALPQLLLDPGEYFALFSLDSKLALSNTAGKARLLDPVGVVVSETSAYQNAKSGSTWALFGEHWLWSTVPTPHHPNKLAETVSATTTTALNKRKAAALGVTNDVTSTSTPASISKYQEPETFPQKINTPVLVSIGVVALLYSLYEYRSEIRTLFIRTREYVRHWRQNRSST